MIGIRRTPGEREVPYPAPVADRATAKLKPHPLNAKVYGDAPDADLIASIEAKGVLTPLIVDDQGRIISGHRRWMVAKKLGLSKVPVLRYYGDLDELSIQRFIIESNRQREKTAGQKARESAELARIESEFAAARRVATLKQNAQPSDVPSEGTSGSRGRTIEKVASQTGQSKNTVVKQIAIVKRADAGDKTAQQALAKLYRDEASVSAAYREVIPFRQIPEKPRLSDLMRYVRNLESLSDTLPGLVANGDKQELDEAVERIRAAVSKLSDLKTGNLELVYNSFPCPT